MIGTRRSTDYDAHAADLISRTLHAVAEATPVEEASPATEVDDDIDLGGARDEALVVHMRSACARPQPRRQHHATIAAAAAAALVLLAGTLWVVGDGDGDGDGENEITRAADPTDPFSVELVPSWLPDDMPARGWPIPPVLATGKRIDGALFRSPDGTSEILVAVVTSVDGEPLGDHVVFWLMGELGRSFAELDTGVDTDSAGARGYVAIGGGSVTQEQVQTVVDRLMAGVPLTDLSAAPPGWSVEAMPLDWLPRLAPTHGAQYGVDGPRHVYVLTVAGDLPAGRTMTTLYPDAQEVAVRDTRGWIMSVPDGEQMLVWQEAPGMIGVALARYLSDDELLGVAGGLQAEPWSVDDDMHVVAEGEIAGLTYSMWWGQDFATMGEGFCDVLLVDGVPPSPIGPSCGSRDDPSRSPFLHFGPVARNDQVMLVWGVLGSNVHTVTSDQPPGPTVDARPVDPADPDGWRYVFVALPRGGSQPVTLTLRDAQGQPLHTAHIYPDGLVGG